MLSRVRAALRPDDRGGGLPRLHLALVLVFVVVAVIELTRIALSAMDVADTAGTIDTRLQPVERNTEQIKRLDRTSTLSGQIMEATRPVEEQAREVEAPVDDIQAGAESVQQTAVAINARVHDITATARDINGTAGELTATVGSIEDTVIAIEGNARGINERFAALLPITEMIDDGPEPFGVENINENTNVIRALGNDLDADLRNVLTSVRKVDQHAASICRSVVVMGC